MKINDSGIPAGAAGLTGDNNISNANRANRSAALEKLGHSGAYGQSSDVSSSNSDQVSISPLAQAVQSLRSDSPDRQARIEELSRQVANGSYQLDSATLSKSLIQGALSPDETTSQ
jgi:flagellar biosynthesis anti-sigma factor FlgM